MHIVIFLLATCRLCWNFLSWPKEACLQVPVSYLIKSHVNLCYLIDLSLTCISLYRIVVIIYYCKRGEPEILEALKSKGLVCDYVLDDLRQILCMNIVFIYLHSVHVCRGFLSFTYLMVSPLMSCFFCLIFNLWTSIRYIKTKGEANSYLVNTNLQNVLIGQFLLIMWTSWHVMQEV